MSFLNNEQRDQAVDFVVDLRDELLNRRDTWVSEVTNFGRYSSLAAGFEFSIRNLMEGIRDLMKLYIPLYKGEIFLSIKPENSDFSKQSYAEKERILYNIETIIHVLRRGIMRLEDDRIEIKYDEVEIHYPYEGKDNGSGYVEDWDIIDDEFFEGGFDEPRSVKHNRRMQDRIEFLAQNIKSNINNGGFDYHLGFLNFDQSQFICCRDVNEQELIWLATSIRVKSLTSSVRTDFKSWDDD